MEVVVVGCDLQKIVHESTLKRGKIGKNRQRTHFLDSLVPGPWLWWSCLTKAQVPLHVEPLPVSAVLTFTSGAPEGDQHTAPIFIPFKLLPFKAPTGCWKLMSPKHFNTSLVKNSIQDGEYKIKYYFMKSMKRRDSNISRFEIQSSGKTYPFFVTESYRLFKKS